MNDIKKLVFTSYFAGKFICCQSSVDKEILSCKYLRSKLPDVERVYQQPSWKCSNENEIQSRILERKESEKAKEISPPPCSQNVLPSPFNSQDRQPQKNVVAFTLKLKSNNKINEGSSANRTGKRNVYHNTPSVHCNSSSQKYMAAEKEGEREQKWGRMENEELAQFCEKKRLYEGNENYYDDNEGWRMRSARLLYPLPYLPNSVQTYKCNKYYRMQRTLGC